MDTLRMMTLLRPILTGLLIGLLVMAPYAQANAGLLSCIRSLKKAKSADKVQKTAKTNQGVKKTLDALSNEYGSLITDEDIRAALKDDEVALRAFNSLVNERARHSEEGQILDSPEFRANELAKIVEAKNSDARIDRSELAKKIKALPRTLLDYGFPEKWAGMVALSSFGVLAIGMTAHFGILPSSEGFEMTWVKTSLSLLAGFVLGNGFVHTDNSIEALGEAVEEAAPANKASVEATMTNLPEAVMALVFFVTTFAGLVSLGDPLVALGVASVTAAAVPIGSIWVNSVMGVAVAITNFFVTLSNGELLKKLESFAEINFPSRMQSLKNFGKHFGLLSSPVLFSKSIIKFLTASLWKARKSIFVQGLVAVPMAFFMFGIVPMMATVATTGTYGSVSAAKLLSFFALFRGSMYLSTMLNTKLRRSFRHTLKIYADELNTDGVLSANQFLDQEIESVKADKEKLDFLIYTKSYLRFQKLAKEGLQEEHRNLAIDAAIALKETLSVSSSVSQRRYQAMVLKTVDDILRFDPDASTSKESDLEEVGNGPGHLRVLVTEHLGTKGFSGDLSKTFKEKMAFILPSVLKLGLATLVLGGGTHLMIHTLNGVNPLFLTAVGSILSSAPEGLVIFSKLRRNQQLPANEIVVGSDVVNLKVADIFYGGSSLWVKPALKKLGLFK